MEPTEDYQNLLRKLDDKAKELKIVYDNLSKKYSSKEISTHPKYDEKYHQWHIVAQKFLTQYVYQ